MQIVIDIDERRFKDILRISTVQLRGRTPTLEQVIAKGIPLPKGHGRLVDEKDLSLMTVHMIDGMFVCDASTIIEADKTESEE